MWLIFLECKQFFIFTIRHVTALRFHLMRCDPKRIGSLQNSHASVDYKCTMSRISNFAFYLRFQRMVNRFCFFFRFICGGCRCFEVNIYVLFHFVDSSGKTINLCSVDELFTSLRVGIYLFFFSSSFFDFIT